MAMSDTNMEVCSGCAGTTQDVPRAPANRAGLPEISARLGNGAAFRRTQLAMLSSSALGKLSELRTRNTDDFSIALIDAWAAAGEVVSFYTDRLANEAYLATARDPLSIREMARLVGYRPGPGVAASAMLAFMMSDAPGSPKSAVIPAGAKVMSTPEQDQLPATYETGKSITARLAWNGIRPRQRERHPLPASATLLSFMGVTTGLKPGDGVLFTADDGQNVFAVIRAVKPVTANKVLDPDAFDLTEVTIERVGGAPNPLPAFIPAFPIGVNSFSPAAQLVSGDTLSAEDMTRLYAEHDVEEDQVFAPWQAALPIPRQVLVFRRRTGTFGNTAPALNTLPESLIGQIVTYTVDNGVVKASGVKNGPFFGTTATSWADQGTLSLLADSSTKVYLDTVVEGAKSSGYAVLRDGAGWSFYSVSGVSEETKNAFTISGKATVLTLGTSAGFANFSIRRAIVYCDSEILQLAPTSVTSLVQDGGAAFIPLDGWFPGLQPGQPIILTGRARGRGTGAVSEARKIAAVEHVFTPSGGTRIRLDADLADRYARGSVRINANVAQATHGETVAEVLGSGDSRIANQSFVTKQAPQTHLSAAVPGGAAPTLEVRVNDVLWRLVPDFLDARPFDRVYVTRTDAEGHMIVTFGDGINGARLPTGSDNVRARYRRGLGLAGRVAARQLNQAMTRPLGLAGVDNPLPSDGGADPQPADSVRANVALTVRTLDRTVSLLDYEDFARAYAGIAKAMALPLWDVGGELIFVTVAGEGGASVPDTGALHEALVGAVRDAGDPYSRFAIGNYRKALFRLGLAIKVNAAHLPEVVLPAVEAALRKAFSFDARALVDPVSASAILACVHAVAGVDAVRINRLYRGAAPGYAPRLPADPPVRAANGMLVPAELLILDPGPLDALELMS
jgi:hypothetical protein